MSDKEGEKFDTGGRRAFTSKVITPSLLVCDGWCYLSDLETIPSPRQST
jgi:hypothetical protein